MNLISRIPVTMRFREGDHPTFILERVAVWPEVRGNATWLIPPPRSGPKGSCPYCHEQRPLAFVCDDRPEDVLSNYDELCPVCNLPIGYHGILGVAFCSACGRPLRVRCEMDMGSAGSQLAVKPEGSPRVGDGGPSFYYAVWAQEDYDALEARHGDLYACHLCHRDLPAPAFHYNTWAYNRDYTSTRCRRCERAWKESLHDGPPT